MLSDDQIDHLAEYHGLDFAVYEPFARAIEAEVRKQDEALIRQLVAALEGYRRNHNDTQPCDAEREGRAWLDGTKLVAAPTTQPAPQPSHTAVRLAELVLSDCGHSSNYTPLLDRVAARIDAHVERRLDELRGCLESNPAPSPAAQGDALDAARYRLVRRGQHWSVIDGIGNALRAEELDAAVDAARAAQEGK